MTKCKSGVDINVFNSSDAVAESIAQQWLEMSKSAAVVNISLSGGSTPKAIFSYIVQSRFVDQICWRNLHFWWGDERCIPANDPQSNYGEAMRRLFAHVSIPFENLHAIDGNATPEEACRKFIDEMAANLPIRVDNENARPVYDWIILGLGEDGHTASLFPAQTDYQEVHNGIVAYHPETKQARVSLSAPAICSAKRVTYLALGTGKKNIVGSIINEAPQAKKLPATIIKSTQGMTEWYLDQRSAASLSI